MMDITREGDSFFTTWPEEGLGFAFERISESSWGRIAAEVTVETIKPGTRRRVAGPFLLGLADLEQQERQAFILSKRGGWSKDQWQQWIFSACSRVLSEWRKPDRAINLRHVTNTEPIRFLVPHMLQEGEINLLYGDGESAKSLLALLIVICCGTGTRLPWNVTPSSTVKPLILDWETNEITVATRIRRLCNGLGIDIPDLAYHRMVRPLSDCLPDLKNEIERESFDLILLDSIGFATRGSLVDDGVARGAISDLRALGSATKLVVGHVPASDARAEKGSSRPFGSVWFWNGMRQGWEVRKSEDSSWSVLDVGLFHRKSNDGARLSDIALSIRFDGINGPIAVSTERLVDIQELADYQRLSTRLREVLKRGARTLAELQEVLDKPVDDIERSLKQMPDAMKVDDGRVWKWGLRA